MNATPTNRSDPATEPRAAHTPAGEPVGHEGTRVQIDERSAVAVGGPAAFLVLLVLVAAFVVGILILIIGASQLDATFGARGGGALGGGIALGLVSIILLFTTIRIISPGHTRVIQFFGRYIGTVRKTGLVLVVPFSSSRLVSVRVRNFETNELKVNDLDGNPINIAAIVVWQVADTAKASFSVEDYEEFVHTQSESALRHVATTHPYDEPGPGETSLRGGTDAVAGELAEEVAQRVALAGVEIVEVRISSLSYAPEIAQAMLQRQQAGAVIAAREQIVEGAVSMVQQALARIEREGVVALDDERKAQMVSNLLVVLCSDSSATPVVNAGSLYA